MEPINTVVDLNRSPIVTTLFRPRKEGPRVLQYQETIYTSPNTATIHCCYGDVELIRGGEGYYHALSGPHIRDGKRLYLNGEDVSDVCLQCNTVQGWALVLVESRGRVIPCVGWGELEIRQTDLLENPNRDPLTRTTFGYPPKHRL